MAIETIKQMQNKLKTITAESVVKTLGDCFVFAFSQLKDHTNSTPVAYLVSVMGSIAKRPNGCTAKNLISFMASNGFEFDKKKGSFSLQDRALFAEFDYDSAITFWTQYQIEAIKLTSIQQLEKFLTKNKDDISFDEAIQLVNKAYNIRELQNVA
jgi:hypothetical protein